MKRLSKHLAEKTGTAKELAKLLKLSGSELNSLLLELFRTRVEKFTPADVLKQFEKSRFTVPSLVDTITFKELEIKWLKFAKNANFIPTTLSPLAPLGACSVFGRVDQNNVVSSVRGAETVSDVTNVLALLVAQLYRKEKQKSPVKYVTTHRLVRGQAFTNPAFSAHFGIFCMVTGGVDTGSFSFETSCLLDHLHTHLMLLTQEFDHKNLFLKLYLREADHGLQVRLKDVMRPLEDMCQIEIDPDYRNGAYYGAIQFKIFLKHKNDLINIVDGGDVDWTQKLTSNSKHRLLISGSGIELVHKILRGIV